MRILRSERLTGRHFVVSLMLCLAVLTAGCRTTPQAKRDKFLAEGKSYLEKKDYSRALLQFKNAAQAMPKDAEPYYQAALAYIGMGDYKSAASFLDKTLQLDSKHIEARVKIAEVMLTSPETENVQQGALRAQEVLAMAPDNIDALDVAALAEWRMGQRANAEEYLRKSLRKLPSGVNAAKSLAIARISERDFAGAEAVLKKAAAQTPPSADIIAALGAFYVLAKRPADAEAQFKKALEINGKHTGALSDLAGLQVQLGRKDDAEQTYKRLSATNDPAFRPTYAIYLFQVGKTKESVQELERLAKADPNDRTARSRLVTAYQRTGRAADAERILADALKNNNKDVDALLQRSAVYREQGKLNLAFNDLTQALSFRPESAEARFGLAQIHQLRGETRSQQQELGEAVRRDPLFLPARLELARSYMAQNAGKSAADLLDGTPAFQKTTIPVRIQRIWAYMAMGQRAEARKALDEVLIAARPGEALFQDALLKTGQKNYAGARTSLDEILKNNPQSVRALNLVVNLYTLQKQRPAGVEYARNYVSKNPHSAPLQAFLGELELAQGDRLKARAAFDAAKAADPKFAPAILQVAALDGLSGHIEQSRQALNELLRINPNNVGARALLGEIEQTAGNVKQAIAEYRVALGLDASNFLALNNLAYLLADQANQPDEALKYAERAKELYPNSSDVEDTLGWVLYKKGLYSAAVRHLETASRANTAAVPQYHLAMAYLKAGNVRRGNETLRAALQRDPKLPEAEAARRVLTEMPQASK